MSESESAAKSVFSFLNLSDHYERKARFSPGLLTVLVLLPVSAAFGVALANWAGELVAGAGLAAILAIAFSQLASAAGNRVQRKYWPRWPHDSPTNRWLHPSDGTRSQQQKDMWYAAIERLTGLDIKAAAQTADPAEQERVIEDAVSRVRNLLWRSEHADRLSVHNADYGFARNLAGLRPVWLTGAVLSCIGCWVGCIWRGTPILWSFVSTMILVLCVVVAVVLPGFVRQRADRYAETFLSTLLALDGAITSSSSKTPQ